jgi:hypothetical protein
MAFVDILIEISTLALPDGVGFLLIIDKFLLKKYSPRYFGKASYIYCVLYFHEYSA